jgi:hypothetical protein
MHFPAMPQAEPCSGVSLPLDIGYSLLAVGCSPRFCIFLDPQNLFGRPLVRKGFDTRRPSTKMGPFRLRIATSCPVDGSCFEIDQRFQILPAQTDSASEQNPKMKTSEEALATIYLTPILKGNKDYLLAFSCMCLRNLRPIFPCLDHTPQ